MTRVEAEVNEFIRQNAPVDTRIMTPDDARAIGAQALFGEKYGDEVRVVSMGHLANSGKGAEGETYSLELCGGTHVRRTGDIGAFALLGDSASSAGVRRIEALTGHAAIAHLRAQDRRLAEVAAALKAQPSEVAERVRALLDDRKALANEVAQLRRDLAMGGGGVGVGCHQDQWHRLHSSSGFRGDGQGLAGARRQPEGETGVRRGAGRGRYRRQGCGGGGRDRRPDGAAVGG